MQKPGLIRILLSEKVMTTKNKENCFFVAVPEFFSAKQSQISLNYKVCFY